MTLGRWLGLLTIILSIYILWRIRTIVLLFLAAVVIATALNCLVRRFRRSHVKRKYAVLLTVAIVLSLLGMIAALISIRLVNQFDQLLELVTISVNQIQVWSFELQSRMQDGMMTNLPSLTSFTRQLQTALNWVIAHIYLFFSNSLALILNTLLVVVLTLMLLANPQQYRCSLVNIFPAFYRQRADEVLSKCEAKLVNYVAGIILSMLFVGFTSTVGLLILHIPLPVVNGLLAGLSAFIPYIGAIASAIPPILLALLDEPWKAVAVLLLYFVIQQVEGNFVTPIIMKRQVNLLPATTLALLTAFGTFFGFLGLLLGLPILVIAQTWLEEAVVHDILDQWRNP
ncbi:AI-2E family transporter [Microcoleus sp. FACHB-1515]|uniref:AI-2E family transporter n=1 Tax=Cyanophyceae TaxID=3028117 RepID=UPI001681E097|nr:AI-2E family transporter [Microcoleus sp. FACHB-1515]MBD2090220.1 AI-2E family transporter [Microcoleus sp. FACHB-1515]